MESCSRFWFQPESEIEEVLKFETYVRNYRKELLKASNEQIAVGQIMIAEIESGKGFSYHRAKINSAHLPNAVCRVSISNVVVYHFSELFKISLIFCFN